MLDKEEILREFGADEESRGSLISATDRIQAAMCMRDFAWVYSKASGCGTWCSACVSEIGPVPVVLGSLIRCPECGKLLERKEEWRGHKYLEDRRFVYIWRRSAADPETVLVKCIEARKEFWIERPEFAPLELRLDAFWQFGPGCARKYERVYGEYVQTKRGIAPEERKHPGAEAHHFGVQHALDGTRVGGVVLRVGLDWPSNPARYDPIIAVANTARRPYLEYVIKQGHEELARDIVYERARVHNPRAKTLRKLLGVTEGQLYEAKRDGITLTGELLHALHAVQDAGTMQISMAEAAQIAARCQSYRLTYLKETAPGLLQNVPPKLRRKAVRQVLRDGGDINTWMDYWKQLRELEEDMTSSALLLPKDLDTMHQRMTDRINMQKNRRKAEELAAKEAEHRKRLQTLRKKYAFEACGLRLEPFETAQEVLDEGTRLHICIGSYAERYLTGGTILCKLRPVDAPDIPWRAVEFSATTGNLVQDRGAYNDAGKGARNKDNGVRERLEAFWEAFNARNSKPGAQAAG